MEWSWTYDAPTGVYKNHAISNRLLEQAVIESKIFPFTRKEDAFGKKMGETYTVFHWKSQDIPSDATLDELQTIPLDDMEMGSVSATVKEIGRGIKFTELSQALGKYDPETQVQKGLKEQLRRYLDITAAAAYKTAKVCFIPTGAGAATWDTDGTPSTAALVNLDLAHLAMIRDYMVNDLHVPMINGDHYVATLTTKACRGIKNDTTFETWSQYLGNEEVLYRSEIGRAESIRAVEINEETALSNSVGTASVLGEGLVFGDDSVGRVEAITPHVRLQKNINNDFGRMHAAAWYGVMAYLLYWQTANDREARVVRITSS